MYIKNSILRLQPGIHILRHSKNGAALTVSRSLGNITCEGELEVLATEKTRGTILRDGSDCIVLLVKKAPVEMLITAYLLSADDPMPSIRVDMVKLDSDDLRANLDLPRAESKQAPFKISENGISLIGHLQNVGDVAVDGGVLLGDPSKQFRLEGFQIMWPDKPPNIDINCQVSIEGIGELPSVNIGNFCGTRGEAKRITEVTLSLIGAQIDSYQLIGVAHFSGGYQSPISSGLTLSGPSGFEHLVALGLEIICVDKKGSNTNAWLDSHRTKTFKSTGKTKEPAKKARS